MSATGDADGLVVDLQADGAGELALDAVSRGAQRARAAATAAEVLLLAELRAGRHEAPEHRHHGEEGACRRSSASASSGDLVGKIYSWHGLSEDKSRKHVL